jgi:hypothetical protein
MEDNINFDNWTKCNNGYYQKIIEFTDSLRNIENINSPYEFYRLFKNDNFLDVLVENTNSNSICLFEKLSKKKAQLLVKGLSIQIQVKWRFSLVYIY